LASHRRLYFDMLPVLTRFKSSNRAETGSISKYRFLCDANVKHIIMYIMSNLDFRPGASAVYIIFSNTVCTYYICTLSIFRITFLFIYPDFC
jgi:hypothetical protein